ncbi:hypothetical protein HMPREF6745_1875 [Prevotella sp. oral taxon 472 str. F0295]|nr:hypothetical protein HMPREF6745_1875 [Prevotella sp. oral taxon 472 str. F0295]
MACRRNKSDRTPFDVTTQGEQYNNRARPHQQYKTKLRDNSKVNKPWLKTLTLRSPTRFANNAQRI